MVPLSQVRQSRDALNVIAQHFIERHRSKVGQFPHRAVIEANDTQMLANTLLFYLDGGAVDMLRTGELVVGEDYTFSQDFLTEMAESIFDVDLSEKEIDLLPLDHPFRILKTALAMQEALKQGIVDNLEYAGLQRAIKDMFHNLIQNISNNDNQLKIHQQAQIKEHGMQRVKILNPQGEHQIPANYFIRREGHMVSVRTLDGPPVLLNEAGVREARNHHETMVRAEKYRTGIQRAMKDFADKPNVDADRLAQREISKRLAIPDNKRPKVTVVGLGPAGAFAAIRAYQEGAIVTGIEKRGAPTRNNTFRFTPEVVDQLIKLFVDKPEDIPLLSPEHPLRKVIDAKSLTEKRASPIGDFYAITIKDFEYLTNAWLDMMAKKDPNGLKIYRGYSYVPGCIQQGDKQVDITDGTRQIAIETDLLVAADGYRSQCRTDCGIDVVEMSTGVKYATLTYHPKRGEEVDLFRSLLKTTPRKPMDLQKLKDLGWEFDRLPVPRYFNTGEHPYLGIEVPQTIVRAWQEKNEALRKAHSEGNGRLAYQLKEERDKILDTWGRATLEMFLTPEEINDLVFKECALIDVKLMKAKKTSATLPGMTVVLIGDAAQAAHFQTGRGAITGIEEANEVGACVEGMCKGKSVKALIEKFNRAVESKTLSLHELAFHFPTKDDLRIKPTREFGLFREEVNVHKLEADHRFKTAQTPKEAQAKANSKLKHTKR